MRFTIRHLLWFTLLAAVGCWWWLPSANDAEMIGRGTSPLGHESVLYIDSEPVLSHARLFFWEHPPLIDLMRRDAVLINLPENFPSRYVDPPIRNRGTGFITMVTFVDGTTGSVLLSTRKHACVFQVTKAQFYMIDGSVATGLLTLAVGSLFVGRKRKWHVLLDTALLQTHSAALD